MLSVFNNKGGVGKTTLTFHLAYALAELGHKTLMVDLDPQCNLTIYSLAMETIEQLWEAEDPYIDEGFDQTRSSISPDQFKKVIAVPRSVHFLLKPTEEGTADLTTLPPPSHIATNLDMIPGRLSLHLYEEKVSSRWSDLYRGDPLAIRTATRIRALVSEYAQTHGYSIVIIDTSPSLGALNKTAILTVDSFLIPCLPDVFSLYGIRNIGKVLAEWADQLRILRNLLSKEKLALFPEELVRFLGFTIYNARRYAGSTPWDLALAHYNYAKKIPDTVSRYIPPVVLRGLAASLLKEPIGGTAVMHSHGTLPSHAQKYRQPIWKLPNFANLESDDRGTIRGNRARYEETQYAYHDFAKAVLARIAAIPEAADEE